MALRTDLSINLLIDGEASIEGLRRAQLFSDVIVIPATAFNDLDKKWDTEIKRMIGASRIQFINAADMSYIADRSQDDPQYTERLLHLLSEAMCRALAAGKAEIEMHEAGHRIRWAYDNGSGEFPATPLTQSFGIVGLRIPIQKFEDSLDDFIERNSGFGASTIQRNYVASAVYAEASQWLLLRRTMERFSQQHDKWPRLGLFGEYSQTVKWTQKILDDNVTLDTGNAADIGKLLAVALPGSGQEVNLSQIDASAFYDLCGGMKEARDRFSRKLVEWCRALASSDSETRAMALRKIRQEEVIPEIEEFNRSAKSLWQTVKGIGGGDLATISVGALTATGFFASGYGPAVSAISALPTTVKVAGDVIKKGLEARREHRRHWVAFATKLNAALR